MPCVVWCPCGTVADVDDERDGDGSIWEDRSCLGGSRRPGERVGEKTRQGEVSIAGVGVRSSARSCRQRHGRAAWARVEVVVPGRVCFWLLYWQPQGVEGEWRDMMDRARHR